jgi:hypothetical protein
MKNAPEGETFDFYSIPIGHSAVLGDDEFGFATILRVHGGWIVRLHEPYCRATESDWTLVGACCPVTQFRFGLTDPLNIHYLGIFS